MPRGLPHRWPFRDYRARHLEFPSSHLDGSIEPVVEVRLRGVGLTELKEVLLRRAGPNAAGHIGSEPIRFRLLTPHQYATALRVDLHRLAQ